MPILDDIMDHDLLGPEIRSGYEAVILSLIEKRFGPVPAWASQHIENLSAAELEDFGLRLLDPGSLEELFGRPH